MKRLTSILSLWFCLAACSSPTGSPGTGADAGDDIDGATLDASSPSGVIAAVDETWTWVDFPDAVCGNGAPTGLAVNLTDRSDDVFVYFVGGGACWDANTCFVLKSAVNIESGYDETTFERDPFINAGGFDRDNPDNPFRDLNWVFVPYCTGDLHAGDRVGTYDVLGQTREVHHVGARNVDIFLDRLAPTFGDAPRVFVGGSSAGGYGAQFNLHRFIDTFDEAEVHLLSDAAPLVQPYGGRLGEMNAAWDLQVPEGCEGCSASFPAWFDYLTSSYPATRFGLLIYDADQVVHLFWNYPFGQSFHDALVAFIGDHYDPTTNARAFVVGGTDHVLLDRVTTLQGPGQVSLSAWVSAWIDGDPSWQTVRP